MFSYNIFSSISFYSFNAFVPTFYISFDVKQINGIIFYPLNQLPEFFLCFYKLYLSFFLYIKKHLNRFILNIYIIIIQFGNYSQGFSGIMAKRGKKL